MAAHWAWSTRKGNVQWQWAAPAMGNWLRQQWAIGCDRNRQLAAPAMGNGLRPQLAMATPAMGNGLRPQWAIDKTAHIAPLALIAVKAVNWRA
ncbi:MAG: hypothetical protein IPL23_08415 [Saprospiraceae bacterium]|nr:hypothetical protein [Saprospiraceae bacterium]